MTPRSLIGISLGTLIILATACGQDTVQKQQQDYAFAMGLFHDGNYDIAYGEFVSFFGKYPESILAADARYYAGECLFRRDLFTDAEIAFKDFLERYPRHLYTDEALFRTGEIAFRRREYGKAFSIFERVVREFPESELAHEATYWAGESALNEGDSRRARMFFRMAVEHYPAGRIRDYADFSLAFMDEREQHFANAFEGYTAFLEKYPSSPLRSSALTRIAACLFGMGERSRAEAWLDSLADSPDADNAAERLAMRAEIRYLSKDYAAAVQHCRTYLEAYPRHSRARSVRYTLGLSLVEVQKYSEAVAEFDSLRGGGDAIAEAAAYGKGIALRTAGRLDEATQTLEELVRTHPKSAWADNAEFELGMLAYQSDHLSEALARFEHVIDAFPSSDVHADSWYMAGESLMKMRRPAEASAYFSAVLRDSTASKATRADAAFRLGHSFFEAGRFDKAAAAFRDFVRGNPGDPRLAEACLWQGESLFQLGRYPEAIDAYEAALAGDAKPGVRYDARYGRCWSYFKLERYADAEKCFDALTREYPGGRQDMDALVRLGDTRYAMKRYPEAVRTYRQAARTYPAHPLAPYALMHAGISEHRGGDTRAGISTIRSMLASYPKSEYADDGQYNLGWLFFQGREYDSAAAEFQRLLQQYPESPLAPRAAQSIGDCLYNRGRYAEAENAYREVIARYPSSPLCADALEGIAQCLSMLGRAAEAATVAERWLSQNADAPAAGSVALSIARKHIAERRLEEATHILARFLREAPTNPQLPAARLLLAQVYRERGLFDSARSTLEILLPPGSDPAASPEAARELARIAVDEQQPRDAIALYDALISSTASAAVLAELHYHRGIAESHAGDDTAAVADFEKAITHDSLGIYGTLAAIEKARCMARRGDIEHAVAMLNDIAGSRSDDLGAEAQFRAGEALLDAGKLDEAERALLRVRYVYPHSVEWSARSLLHLGTVYDRQGKTAKARETYETILRLYKGSDTAAEAATRLERLR